MARKVKPLTISHAISSNRCPFVFLNIPHSSTVIPEVVRPSFLLSDKELEHELLLLTDAYTDDLFQVHSDSVVSLIFPISRLVVDPERFPDDNDEPMSKKGMGVIYTKTSSGKPLRQEPTQEERIELLLSFYYLYQNELNFATKNALSKYGYSLIIDCHSFPSKPLPYEDNQDSDRPDICIGIDDFHTPDWLAEETIRLFTEYGYSVKLNTPFAGSLTPQEYFRSDQRVLSIMFEINRSLYMNEITGKRIYGYHMLKRRLTDVLSSVTNCFSKMIG